LLTAKGGLERDRLSYWLRVPRTFSFYLDGVIPKARAFTGGPRNLARIGRSKAAAGSEPRQIHRVAGENATLRDDVSD